MYFLNTKLIHNFHFSLLCVKMSDIFIYLICMYLSHLDILTFCRYYNEQLDIVAIWSC